jgi:hypothetical protein
MRALIATGLIVAAAQAGDHRVEIDYYTHHYDGADIALSRFTAARACAKMLACYGRFRATTAHHSRRVADAMSDAELAAAQQLMSQVFSRGGASKPIWSCWRVLSARSASGRPPDLPVQTRQLPDRP